MYCLDDGTPLVRDTNASFNERATIKFSGKQTLENPPQTNNPMMPPVWSPHSSQPPATNWTNAQTPYAQGYQQSMPYYAQRTTSPTPLGGLFLAIASLIVGVFSATLGWICIGVFSGPIAIILGVLALVKCKLEQAHSGKGITIGLAIVGILLGSIVPCFFLLYMIIAMLT